MAKNIIVHCNKRMPTASIFLFKDYPYQGDNTVALQNLCQICKNNAYAYYTDYLCGICDEFTQADEHKRKYFDNLIKQCKGIIIPKLNPEHKDTKGKMHAGEFTMRMKLPPEMNISYINMILDAPTVSTMAKDLIEKERQKWIKQLHAKGN